MISRKQMNEEVEQARRARIEAEAAYSDLEELIWDVQHVRLGRQRIVFSIDGFDQESIHMG